MDLPIVEVRDKNLVRHGVLSFESVSLTVLARFNGVGDWVITIGDEHPLVNILRAPGSGIVCNFNGRIISGWTRSAELAEDAGDPGTWTITGVTDDVLLASRLTYPNPAQAADAQTSAYYNISGPFETVAKEMVRRQLGPGALPERQLLSVAPDLGRGDNIILSSRFKPVLEELRKHAVLGGLGFQVAQHDEDLVFEVFEPVDRSREIQLDVENGGLDSAGWGYEAPASSIVFPAGQGEGADRTIVSVSTPESLSAATEWGFTIETFKDQRDTDDVDELVQAGLEILAGSGTTGRVISMEPSSSPSMRPGLSYWLGDTITVQSKAGVAQAQITGVDFMVTSEGFFELVSVGDPVGFSFEARMGERVETVERRVADLERSESGGSGDDSISRDELSIGGQGPSGSATNHLANANDATTNGWYSYTEGTLNRPGGTTARYGTILVSRNIGQGDLVSGAWVTQIAFSTTFTEPIMMRQNINNTGWSEWEDGWRPQDTGWIQPPWTGDFETGLASAGPIVYRRRNGFVEVKGSVRHIDGRAFTTTFDVVAQLPAGFRPGTRLDMGTAGAVVRPGQVMIATNGNIGFASSWAATGQPAPTWLPVHFFYIPDN